jgi:hypothetical protein
VTFLLDTNVLSETRKRQPDTGVIEWITATPSGRLYVSVLTLGRSSRASRIRDRGDNQQAAASNAGYVTLKWGSRTGFCR